MIEAAVDTAAQAAVDWAAGARVEAETAAESAAEVTAVEESMDGKVEAAMGSNSRTCQSQHHNPHMMQWCCQSPAAAAAGNTGRPSCAQTRCTLRSHHC